MTRVWIVVVVLLLAVGVAFSGEVRIVATEADGGPQPPMAVTALGPERAAGQTAKTGEVAYKAWLPFFVVDSDNPGGVNTLFAVRNCTDQTLSITYRYYPPSYSYSDAVIVHETLNPRQTRTVSVREIQGIPADPATGMKTGVVEIEHDGMTGYIGGDWFLIDPANNFASGDRLVSFDSFCYRWDSRYFHGGAFSGGTTFTFFLGSNLSGGTSPIVVGQVYDEAGILRGTVQIYTADQGFEVNTADLPAHILGSAGVIEWTFQNPYNGYVHTTFRALGKYTAGLPSMCVDNASVLR